MKSLFLQIALFLGTTIVLGFFIRYLKVSTLFMINGLITVLTFLYLFQRIHISGPGLIKVLLANEGLRNINYGFELVIIVVGLSILLFYIDMVYFVAITKFPPYPDDEKEPLKNFAEENQNRD